MALQGKNYTSLTDMWAAPIKLDDETGTIEITIVEESGKICLNGLALPDGTYEPSTWAALKQLGIRLQIPDDCWSSLADWLDTNDEPRSGGAETSSYYKTLKPPYSARNGKLATLAELSLIKGFTPEIVAKLQRFVTIYSGQPGGLMVNINTAPMEVIAALDKNIDDRMAGRILDERRVKPFESAGDLASRVAGGTISAWMSTNVSYKGTLFRITSVARVKETARTVEAVVRVDGGQQNILSWQEY
jgi:general secretion pathway protein K